MGRLHLCLLLVFMYRASSAQFPDFPDSNAFWLMEVNDGPEVLYQYGYHLRSTNHDTLINGAWYNTIWGGAIGQTGIYFGGLRESEDGRVYYHHANTDSTYLLYDFDPAIGDSMEVWVGDPYVGQASTQWIYVDTIETLQNFLGTDYRQIGIVNDNSQLSAGGAYHYWIQGVGGTGGLFSTIGSTTVSLEERLICMQANDSLWPQGGPWECWPLGLDERTWNGLRLAPNPSSGIFHVAVPLLFTFRVLDPQGREVLHIPAASSEIDLSGHPPGVYMAVLQEKSIRHVQRLVVLR